MQENSLKSAASPGPLKCGPASDPFIKIHGLERVFSSKAREVVALDGITLDIGMGEFVSVVGPSGCGKTTLMNIVAGLDKATSGSVKIQDRLVDAPVTDVGIVFQDPTLMEW